MHARILCTLLVTASLAAQAAPLRADTVPERHHVIVVLDRSGSMVHGGASRWAMLERTVTRRLRDACFTPGWALPGRRLLDPASGDVLSIVSFGLERGASDFSRFIQVEEGGTRYGMLRRADAPADVFDGLWRTIVSFGPGGFFSGHLSGISLSMPLALEYEGRHGAADDRPVHRTFVLLVTDDRYNGPGTVNLELDELARTSLGGAVDEVRRRVGGVYEQYGFAERRADDGAIRLKLFEVVPRHSFDIRALWGFNNEAFPFRRVDGGFRSDFHLSRREDAPITLRTQRIEALLMDGGAVIGRRTVPTGQDAVIAFALPAGARAGSLSVRLRFWVRQADSVYGMRLYDPDGPELATRAALRVTIPVRLEPAGLILGVIPVGSWAERPAAWVGVHGQAAVVRLWNFVILAAAVLAAVVAVFSWALRASTITSGRELMNGRMEGAR
jgi:hypothetical protein